MYEYSENLIVIKSRKPIILEDHTLDSRPYYKIHPDSFLYFLVACGAIKYKKQKKMPKTRPSANRIEVPSPYYSPNP